MEKQFGLLGERLEHSISPFIHREIFKSWRIEGKYDLFEVEKSNLKAFVTEAKNNKISGFNVTIPYKIDVIQLLDSVSSEAQSIGAVNTIVKKGNILKGYNTDYYGIHLTFKKNNVDIKNSSAVILGNGGASAAVFQYLKDYGCAEIIFVVRNKEKAEKVFKDCRVINFSDLKFLRKKDILINCTPVGMYPNIGNSPLTENDLHGFNFVFDLIYNPLETELLKQSLKQNIPNSNGLLMLIGQAIYAEALWNNLNYENINLSLLDLIYDSIAARGILK